MIKTDRQWRSSADRGIRRLFIVAMRIIGLALSACIGIGLVLVLIRFRGEIASGVMELTQWLPIGYAFAAGMVASVNPCGVLMLPAYISYQFSSETSRRPSHARSARALQALSKGAIISFAFVMVFALTGGIIAAGGQWLVNVFPWAGALVGVLMAGLGLWLFVTNGHLGIAAASRVYVSPARSLSNAFLFGIAYAVASLGCTLPIFLVVVGSALVAGQPLHAFGQFISYAAGMSTVVAIVMLASALFEELVTNFLLRIIPYIGRIGALFLFGAGLYLSYYGISQSGLRMPGS